MRLVYSYLQDRWRIEDPYGIYPCKATSNGDVKKIANEVFNNKDKKQ